jgi:hypothetical protein
MFMSAGLPFRPAKEGYSSMSTLTVNSDNYQGSLFINTHNNNLCIKLQSMKKIDNIGGEYWLATELMEVFGYQTWEHFSSCIKRAIQSCHISIDENFVKTSKKLTSKPGRPKEEYRLSKTAVELIYLNIHTSKRTGKFSRNDKQETSIRDKLAKKLVGQVEAKTPVGNIDILTETEVIEVKILKHWKAALGQVLAYSYFFPSHKKRIHLFNVFNEDSLQNVIEVCSYYNVTVTYQG